jgi:hypothetical protein
MIRYTSEISPIYGRIWAVRDDETNVSAWGLTQTEARMAFALRAAFYADRENITPADDDAQMDFWPRSMAK